MARNHKFFFDADRIPRARGPAAEKTLMTFLETDVQGSDHVCHDLMDDLVAIEDGSDDQREFIGNAHRVTIDADGVTIEPLHEGEGGNAESVEGSGDANPVSGNPIDAGTVAEAVPGEKVTADEPSPAVSTPDVGGVAGDTGTVSAGEAAKVADQGSAQVADQGAAQVAAQGAAQGAASGTAYRTGAKHFREVLEDWEAFILDDDLADDALLLDDDYA